MRNSINNIILKASIVWLGIINKLFLFAGIFEHLYGPHAFFHPVVPLFVEYDYDEDTVTPVFRGNIIKPKEVTNSS